jgi:hypothetical protein
MENYAQNTEVIWDEDYTTPIAFIVIGKFGFMQYYFYLCG